MDPSDILQLQARFTVDADAPLVRALVRRARADSDLAEVGPLHRLCADEGALNRAAALVSFAIGAEPRPSPDALAGVFRCLLLADALERRLDEVIDVDGAPEAEATRDLEALPIAATGRLTRPAGPLSAWLLDLRRAFAGLPGWAASGDLLSATLANLVDGLLGEHRLRALGTEAVSVGPRWGTSVALAVRACAVVLGDDTEAQQPEEAETALRLAASVLDAAHDLGVGLRGDAHGAERVAQRLGLPVSVVRLSPDELRRILITSFDLDLHDLADTLSRLDIERPWPGLVARITAALLALDDDAAEVASLPPRELPPRDDTMGQLRSVARSGGEITSDERALLRSMDIHLHAFRTLLDRIEEDQIVDFEELGQLRATRRQILEDLLRVALGDDEITQDERRLLVRAIELLPALR